MAFRKAGQGYFIPPSTTSYPAAEHIVKPMHDDGATVVRWWQKQEDGEATKEVEVRIREGGGGGGKEQQQEGHEEGGRRVAERGEEERARGLRHDAAG